MLLFMSLAAGLFVLTALSVTGSLQERYQPAILIVVSILAFMLSFLRWETGTDWASYIAMFGNLTRFNDVTRQIWWGPAYASTAVLVNSVDKGNYTLFLFLIGGFLFSTKIYALLKTCMAPLVALFFLFCTNFYDIFFVRQDVAIVLVWVFSYFYFHRNYKVAAAAAVGAVLFHYSAALAIAVVALLGRPGIKKSFGLMCLMAVLAYVILSRFSLKDLASLTTLGGYIDSAFIEQKASVVSTTSRAYLKLLFFVLLVIWGYFAFLRRPVRNINRDWIAFCLRVTLGIVLAAAVLLPVSEVFSRIPSYALPFLAVVLSNYTIDWRRFSVRSGFYLAILALLFVELVFLFTSYAADFYPIKTIVF